MIDKDQELIDLRVKITKTASSQLSNGTITSTEYLTQLNEEKQAKLNKETHEIQLINAKLNYLSAIGKL
jgi:outer membrane protein TolC